MGVTLTVHIRTLSIAKQKDGTLRGQRGSALTALVRRVAGWRRAKTWVAHRSDRTHGVPYNNAQQVMLIKWCPLTDEFHPMISTSQSKTVGSLANLPQIAQCTPTNGRTAVTPSYAFCWGWSWWRRERAACSARYPLFLSLAIMRLHWSCIIQRVCHMPATKYKCLEDWVAKEIGQMWRDNNAALRHWPVSIPAAFCCLVPSQRIALRFPERNRLRPISMRLLGLPC